MAIGDGVNVAGRVQAGDLLARLEEDGVINAGADNPQEDDEVAIVRLRALHALEIHRAVGDAGYNNVGRAHERKARQWRLREAAADVGCRWSGWRSMSRVGVARDALSVFVGQVVGQHAIVDGDQTAMVNGCQDRGDTRTVRMVGPACARSRWPQTRNMCGSDPAHCRTEAMPARHSATRPSARRL